VVPRKFGALTNLDKDRVVKLFHDGYGAQKISSILKLSSGVVARYLRSMGMIRTKTEAYSVSKEIRKEAYWEMIKK